MAATAACAFGTRVRRLTYPVEEPAMISFAAYGIFRLGWIGVVILVVLGALRLYMAMRERRR